MLRIGLFRPKPAVRLFHSSRLTLVKNQPSFTQNETLKHELQKSEGPKPSEVPKQRRTLAVWCVEHLPKKLQPYARLSRMDKPIGTWLLYSPCTWALTIGATMAGTPPSALATIYGVFLFGAFLTRGAGCTINDIWDRKMDAKVARTMDRPLAAKDCTVKQATTWLGVQGVASLGVLASLPKPCWLVGAASIVPVLVYPLFKRFTYYPQIWLSLWFSWGAVLAFPALGLSLGETAVLGASMSLLTAGFSWSMIYDTIYGHQDKRDDVKVGVKSTALKWGDRTKPIAYRFWALQSASLVAAGSFGGMGPAYLTGCLVSMTRLFRMIRKVDLSNPEDCGKFFKRNLWNGHIVWLGALVDYLVLISFFMYQMY